MEQLAIVDLQDIRVQREQLEHQEQLDILDILEQQAIVVLLDIQV